MSTYFMPTKIIKGEGCVLNSPDMLILGKKAFIVTGKRSGALSGALNDVMSVLENSKIPYYVYDKIENNPEISAMAEGGRVCREFGADYIIAIGGGSPLDAAKAISVYCTNEPRECGDFTLYDIFTGSFKNAPLPMCAIPTTAGTGSEVTPYSILTLHREQTKRSFSSPHVFYKTAFLDPKYTANLPLQITRNTAVDAMCHLLEGYTNKKSSELTDYIALEGLKLIEECKNGLLTGNLSLSERDKLLYASCLGGIVISQTGTTIVHSMGYALTYFHDIPHGMANGYLVYEYLMGVKGVNSEKVDNILFSLGFKNTDEFKDYLEKILPRVANFNLAELEGFAKSSIKAKNVASCPFDITEADELEIYKKSLL